MEPSDRIGPSAIFKLEGALVSKLQEDLGTNLQCKCLKEKFVQEIFYGLGFCISCLLQGIDMEGKADDKGSKAGATNYFGANTPSVSCTFERK